MKLVKLGRVAIPFVIGAIFGPRIRVVPTGHGFGRNPLCDRGYLRTEVTDWVSARAQVAIPFVIGAIFGLKHVAELFGVSGKSQSPL